MSNMHKVHSAEVAIGAYNELARQGGQNLGLHPHGAMKVGETIVKGAAVVAPGAVAAASAGTAAAIHTLSAAAVALAPVAIPAGAAAAACYGIYRLFKWIGDQ